MLRIDFCLLHLFAFLIISLPSLASSSNACFSENNESLDTPELFWKEKLKKEIWERTCGLDPETAKPLRNNREYFSSSWATGINLTAVTLNVPRGTAITKKHVIYTKHSGYHAWPGQTLHFLTQQNEVIQRVVKGYKYLDKPDIAVIQLDEDLPESISPMKIISKEGQDLVFTDTPLLRVNQQNKALVVEKGSLLGELKPPGAPLDPYYEPMTTGDSSSPSILIFSNLNGPLPILYSLVTYSGTGNGPLLSQILSEIQSAIRGFGDQHAFEVFPRVAKCSLNIQRQADTEVCQVLVSQSHSEETEAPILLPNNASSWSRKQNAWSGQVSCSKNENTLFSSFLKNSS